MKKRVPKKRASTKRARSVVPAFREGEAPDSTKFQLVVFTKKSKLLLRAEVLIVEAPFGIGMDTPMTFIEVIEPRGASALVHDLHHVRHGKVVNR